MSTNPEQTNPMSEFFESLFEQALNRALEKRQAAHYHPRSCASSGLLNFTPLRQDHCRQEGKG